MQQRQTEMINHSVRQSLRAWARQAAKRAPKALRAHEAKAQEDSQACATPV